MDPQKLRLARMLASLRESGSADGLGAAGVALGIVLVALGWVLEEASIGLDAVIRTLGGICFLAGLGTVVFGNSPPSCCCDWRVEAHGCKVYVEDCALGLARQGGTGRGDRRARAVRPRRGVPGHLPKRGGVRGAGRSGLLGWSCPAHIRQILRSRRGADPWPVLFGSSWKGTRRREPVAAPASAGLAREPGESRREYS